MTNRSVTHATFQLERTYAAPTKRVWAAFADQQTKQRWFHGPEEWGPDKHQMDFRVGGRESSEGGPPGEASHRFDAQYFEIVDESRIVFAYDMYVGGEKLSTSLTTIELKGEGDKTRLVFTEQGAYYDGLEDPKQREEGTAELLRQVAEAVE
jgi:uncharacterized protein YndB with AHSA1/START domain